MRRLDELHLDYPFAGSRMLRDLLRGEGVSIGRQRVATMMKRMGIAALYRQRSILDAQTAQRLTDRAHRRRRHTTGPETELPSLFRSMT